MSRMFGAAVVGLFAGAVAHGHFAYVVPAADGASAKVVFSDTLDPDMNVNIEKLANTKLVVRDAAGKDTPLEWKKGDACYEVKVPGSGPRTVYGTTEYGVLQKGDAKPFRLTYYLKAILGGVPDSKAVAGTAPVLDIVPAGKAGEVRFRVLAAGKPVADAEAGLILPGGEKQAVKTDKDGYTPTFTAAGRYGMNAKLIEAKGGELDGKKYDEVRHYATLVVDIK